MTSFKVIAITTEPRLKDRLKLLPEQGKKLIAVGVLGLRLFEGRQSGLAYLALAIEPNGQRDEPSESVPQRLLVKPTVVQVESPWLEPKVRLLQLLPDQRSGPSSISMLVFRGHIVPSNSRTYSASLRSVTDWFGTLPRSRSIRRMCMITPKLSVRAASTIPPRLLLHVRHRICDDRQRPPSALAITCSSLHSSVAGSLAHA